MIDRMIISTIVCPAFTADASNRGGKNHGPENPDRTRRFAERLARGVLCGDQFSESRIGNPVQRAIGYGQPVRYEQSRIDAAVQIPSNPVFCQLEDKKRNLINAACEKGKQILSEAGWDSAYVSAKAEPKRKGIARDIITEAQQGYDLIVIGKHGVSGIRDFFLGSISQKVLQLAKDISVLIVN
jgi:nucleotide-binding universal stress UspA family protein